MLTEDLKLISNLTNDPAYLALLAHLEEENAGVLEVLAQETDPSKMLQLMRFWQVAKQILTRLKIAPAAIAEEFTLAKVRAAGESGTYLEDFDDPFIHKRTVPPPSQDSTRYNSIEG